MSDKNIVITVSAVGGSFSKDLEVPLDISAFELCEALYSSYFPEFLGKPEKYCLRAERPVAFLRGDKTLREFGLRNGSVINIVGTEEQRDE